MAGIRRRRTKRHITVQGVEYRWHATGDDGYITIWIKLATEVGPGIRGNFKYHETWVKQSEGMWKSAGDQIVITPRIIRRVIELALQEHGYDPMRKGKELNLKNLNEVVDLNDAIRAGRTDDA